MILRKISTIFIGVSLAFFAMGGLALLIFNRPSTGWKALHVTTGSMRPRIKPGSLVFVHRIPEKDYKVGDVVTYINPKVTKETITHRIVADGLISNKVKSFTTKGDANPNPDLPIPAGSVIGKTIVVVPYVGKVLSWTMWPAGLIALIYLPALLIIFEEIRRLARYYKSQRPYLSPEMERRLKAEHHHIGLPHIGATAKIIIPVVLVATLFAAVPAVAITGGTASLTGNTLAAQEIEPPDDSADHVVIRRVNFRCFADNTETLSKSIELAVYNPTKQSVDISGWTIESVNGLITTIPSNTILKAKHTFKIEMQPFSGLIYAGDFLAIFNSGHDNIDGLSWGSNTSQLNPSLPAALAGSRFKRHLAKTDTNTPADWQQQIYNKCKDRENDHDITGQIPPGQSIFNDSTETETAD